MNTTKINYAAMTGPGLVHAYNEMVAEAAARGLDGYRPVAKFQDTKTGVKRCEALASGLRARKDGLRNGAAASEPEATIDPDAEHGAAPEVPEVAKTLIDAHVAEVERAGAEVTKLGTAAEPDSITSQTSLGALTTVELKGGKHKHEWETSPAKTKKKIAAEKRAARAGKSAGKSPGLVADFRSVKPATIRAKIVALAGRDGGATVDELCAAAGVGRSLLLSHLHCLHRDCAHGYDVTDGRVTMTFPGQRTVADALGEKS